MFSHSSGQILGIADVLKSVLNWFLENILKTLLQPVIDLLCSFYYFLCKTAYSAFILPIARIADICQMIFRKFAGIDSMQISGLTRSNIFGSNFSSDDIVMNLISSDIVQRIFLAMLVLAVILIVVTTFIANIKAEFNPQDKGGNNRKKVFKNAFKGLLNFVVVPVTCLLAIVLSNVLLQAIDGATRIEKQQTYLSNQLFLACAYNENRVRNSQDNEQGMGYYYAESFGALITGDYETGVQDSSKGYGNFGIFLDDESDYGLRAADKIDQAFANGRYIRIREDTNATQLYYGKKLSFWYGGKDLQWSGASMIATVGGTAEGGYTTFPAGYNRGIARSGDFVGTDSSFLDFMLGDVSFSYYLHFYNNKLQGSDEGIITFSIYDVGLVSYYYDLSFTSFNFIIFIIAGFYFCYVLLVTAIGLIKRLLMISILFVISPPICALYPIDDGQALGRWRTNFVKEVLSAYAVIVVMNIFLSLLPLLTKIDVFTINNIPARVLQLYPLFTWWVNPSTFNSEEAVIVADNITSGALSGVVNILNAFARLLIIVGALYFFKEAVKAIAQIIGGGNAFEDGSAVAKKMANTIGGAATLAFAGGTMVASKFKRGSGGNPSPNGGADATQSDTGGRANDNVAPRTENSLNPTGGGSGTGPTPSPSPTGGISPTPTGGNPPRQTPRSANGIAQNNSGNINSLPGLTPEERDLLYRNETGEDAKDFKSIRTQRNAWQKFSKFANVTKMIKDVATGNSGVAGTIKAIESNNDYSKLLKPFDKDKAKKEAQERHNIEVGKARYKKNEILRQQEREFQRELNEQRIQEERNFQREMNAQRITEANDQTLNSRIAELEDRRRGLQSRINSLNNRYKNADESSKAEIKKSLDEAKVERTQLNAELKSALNRRNNS